jgi:chromosome transmission fidelity protein 1
MCINESVLSLKNSTLINERCLEMQKNKSKPKKTDSSPPNKKRKKGYQNGGSCEFFKSSAISNLRDQSLLEVQDIEQLVQKGRQMNACPYYASRKAIEDAQIVIIPYNTLLHSSTREAINIQLENSVVIIDEAHNVLETIAHIHSAEITKSHLVQAQDQLKAYFKKDGGLLKAKNLLYIKHHLFLLSKLLKIFMMQSIDKTDKATMSARLMQFSDFLAETDILDLNIFKLIRYVEKSKISHKLRGFYKTKMEKDSAGVTEENNTEQKRFNKFPQTCSCYYFKTIPYVFTKRCSTINGSKSYFRRK